MAVVQSYRIGSLQIGRASSFNDLQLLTFTSFFCNPVKNTSMPCGHPINFPLDLLAFLFASFYALPLHFMLCHYIHSTNGDVYLTILRLQCHQMDRQIHLQRWTIFSNMHRPTSFKKLVKCRLFPLSRPPLGLPITRTCCKVRQLLLQFLLGT
jgi:hypothetical protein